MPFDRCHPLLRFLAIELAVIAFWASDPVAAPASSLRRTAIVEAVDSARPSVVNIRGHKTVPPDSDAYADLEPGRRVNGMGTGVIVDDSGYIITNHHVVEGVKRIQVTLADRRAFVAELVAHDPETDLAIIKISVPDKLPVIRIGTSSDLMQGEELIAVGNAYGYEHTVTRGIISALHRDVQVSDAQRYDDLIQTDASINPGNSGGPLLNIDGEMIGLNVAVRVGAQGIGFAIPVDRVVEVAARLMNAERISGVWHGIRGTRQGAAGKRYVIDSIEPGSPAEASGLRPGDVVLRVESCEIERQLDLERAMLGRRAGQEVQLAMQRQEKPLQIRLVVAAVRPPAEDDRFWTQLGLRLSPVSLSQYAGSRYQAGLKVKGVRPEGPAARLGMRPGDVLVGIHQWSTESLSDVNFVLNHDSLSSAGPVKFYFLRNRDEFYVQLPSSVFR